MTQPRKSRHNPLCPGRRKNSIGKARWLVAFYSAIGPEIRKLLERRDGHPGQGGEEDQEISQAQKQVRDYHKSQLIFFLVVRGLLNKRETKHLDVSKCPEGITGQLPHKL